MNSKLKLDDSRLYIFHEGRRRIFVGELIYYKDNDKYKLIYDKKYAHSKNAIPIGPELDLFKTGHVSAVGELFPSLRDRIPSKLNPAYKDYCKSQGISINEENPIILLGFIGKRGPSSFIFEPSYKNEFSKKDILSFRENLKISQYDLATAFGLSEVTLQRIETGKSQDDNTLTRIQIYFEFPEVALWQLKQTGNKVRSDVLVKLVSYFESKL
jgi:DNA-binding XRE family transcriptional regulator